MGPSRDAIVLRIQRTHTYLADKSLRVLMQASTARRTENSYCANKLELGRHTFEREALFHVD